MVVAARAVERAVAERAAAKVVVETAAGRVEVARAVVMEAGARAVEMAAAAKVVVRAVVETVAAMVEVVREVVTGKFRARKQRRCTRPPSLTHARRGRACWRALLATPPEVARDRLEDVQRRFKAPKWRPFIPCVHATSRAPGG